MRSHLILLCTVVAIAGCSRQPANAPQLRPAAVDRRIADFVSRIRAIDNHTHVNSTASDDADSDALPLESLPPFAMPARLRPDNPEWLAAYRALYDYRRDDVAESHLPELRSAMQRVRSERGERFPEGVLDRVGTEVMLANRVVMGPGLTSPRFRWVPFVDALMFPLSNKREAAMSPDRQALYPLEEKLLRRYLGDLGVPRVPPTLDEYVRAVVTPTLERQRQSGAVAVKFEAAYLRSLDFADAPAESASRVYARYIGGGDAPHDEYKALQDFLFHYICAEAGRLGLAVHIHSFEGAGSFYRVAGSDPLLLESAFNDPDLRSTTFVIVHGGGVFASHAGALLSRPNVYVDTSGIALLYDRTTLASILAGWLRQYPDKVLFGTDAAAFGPDQPWDVTAWLGTSTVRDALGAALTQMLAGGDISHARAEEIATMVMRTNAAKLYKLPLN